MRTSLAVAVLLAALATLPAEADEPVPPVTDAVVTKECGSCHLVFPPQFLPQRSWRKLIETLADHFGENASLGETQRKVVLDYLVAHAADSPNAGREGRKFAASIASADTPLRITETPRWVKEHRKVRPERWQDPKVRSKANCLACHPGAAQGIYDD
ncbi:MAG: diheme cytochrome c [Candidatus Methylomirabilales bacterium]